MPTTYIFGAGASHSYTGGIYGERPPLQSNFWELIFGSEATATGQVRRGALYTYLDDADLCDDQGRIRLNVEELMTKVHQDLLAALEGGKGPLEPLQPGRVFPITAARLAKLYQELVLLFAQTVNNLSVGGPCSNYRSVVDQITPRDTLITFNWDVILDRVLWESGRWGPAEGYGVSFGYIMDGNWYRPESTQKRSELKLFKLHGSTNWLEPYVVFDLQDGRRKWIFRPKTQSVLVCYVNCETDLPSYHDLYTSGGPFCYGFPPNHPELPENGYLYPMIIPPSLIKYYDELRIPHLWAEAKQRVQSSDQIIVIGYSFPPTDEMSWDLIRAATLGPSSPTITLVGPRPQAIGERLKKRLGNKIPIEMRQETFAEYANSLQKGRNVP